MPNNVGDKGHHNASSAVQPSTTDQLVDAIYQTSDGVAADLAAERTADEIATVRTQAVNAYTSTEALREWQPIETAPRDGSQVLLFWPFITQDGLVTSGNWYEPHDADPYWYSGLVNSGATPPTYWMPLPPAPDAARTALAGSAGGRIKVTARGVSIRVHTWALAELASEMAGPGAEIRYVPEGSDDGWCVWTEGETWPDEDDFRYHLFALEVKRLRRERHSLAPSAGVTAPRHGIYIASKTKHADRWRLLRDKVGEPIISTWIDEAGEGESADLNDLWHRCLSEAANCALLILYREPGDVLKGGWIELGAALANGVPVFAVGVEEYTVAKHQGIRHFPDMKSAIAEARAFLKLVPSAGVTVPSEVDGK